MPEASRKYRLCVMVKNVGALSETFVCRHTEGILPGETCVVADAISSDRAWAPSGPCLTIYRAPTGLLRSLERQLYRLFPGLVNRRVAEFFRVHGVEAVLVEFFNFRIPMRKVARELGIRWVPIGHGFDLSERFRDPKTRQSYQAYANDYDVVVRNKTMADRLVGIGYKRDRIHVVSGGAILSGSLPERDPSRRTVKLVAVGRMIGKKAPLLLLKAVIAAAERNPDLEFDYVGSGPLFEASSLVVTASGLQNRIRLLGGQPHSHTLELMAEADIFVQHSMVDPDTGDEEGLPLSILEAMGCGLPVVSTRHAGIPEAVEDGVTGLLVDEGDVTEMTEAILRLADDSELRTRMGVAGFQRAHARFTLDHEFSQLRKALGFQESEA